MRRLHIGRKVTFIFGLGLAIVYAMPFLLVILNSLKGKYAILEDPIAFPEKFEFKNFTKALDRMHYWTTLTNSAIITTASLICLIVVSSMLAYYLARKHTTFSKTVFMILVASMIVPFQALMIPFTTFFGGKGTMGFLHFLKELSQVGLVVFYIGFGVAMTTFLYHGFISNIPYELDEAAKLDGASDLGVFWKVIFPMLTPVTATVAIINALWIWNDFLLPWRVLGTNSEEVWTLPLSTYTFYGMYSAEYGLAMAGLLLSVTPIVIFYFILQRQIISGISSGAVK
jgi:raffinose/stachyose/melibiose transport system permease protein